MLTKHIYVSYKDLEVFKKAEALTKRSLSAAVVKALKQYVSENEAKLQGFEENKLPVGYLYAGEERF